MDLLKAIFIFMLVIVAVVVGTTVGFVLIPFAAIAVIYFIIKVVTYEHEEEI